MDKNYKSISKQVKDAFKPKKKSSATRASRCHVVDAGSFRVTVY